MSRFQMNPNMFSMNQGFGQPQNNQPIVKFKAGRMHLSNGKVSADTQKGWIQLINEDGMLQFQWRTRPTNVLDLNVIVTPEMATFDRVEQAKDNAKNNRVYVLNFTDSDRVEFFWMQEPKEEKDEENVKKVNEALENPMGAAASNSNSFQTPTNQSTTGAMGGMGGLGGMGGMGGMGSGAGGQQDLMNMLQGAGSQNGGNLFPPTFLQSALRGGLGGGNNMSQFMPQPPRAHLSDILSAENLQKPLMEEEVIADLIEYLPDGLQTPEEFTNMLRSPVFNAAIHHLHSLVASRQLGFLLQNFDLDVDQMCGVNEFLDALLAIEVVEDEEEEEEEEQEGKMDVEQS
eukprot:TRINITY_DN811_c3_g1_i3.p1 TRINITY_DN811_c3_g1~~TRINITY_DN811_c3_g1_i3.p1  ORF type:complete len:344 (+),score=126.75 TRINITY_DN811_c3_g1_i3:79-1110(+)